MQTGKFCLISCFVGGLNLAAFGTEVAVTDSEDAVVVADLDVPGDIANEAVQLQDAVAPTSTAGAQTEN